MLEGTKIEQPCSLKTVQNVCHRHRMQFKFDFFSFKKRKFNFFFFPFWRTYFVPHHKILVKRAYTTTHTQVSHREMMTSSKQKYIYRHEKFTSNLIYCRKKKIVLTSFSNFLSKILSFFFLLACACVYVWSWESWILSLCSHFTLSYTLKNVSF